VVLKQCRSCARASWLPGVWRGKKDWKKEDGEPEVVLNFADTHEALMKVKSFFYAHRTSDSDRESVLGLEKSYFELRRKVCTNKCNQRFFQQEVIIIIKLFLSLIFNGFPVLFFSPIYRSYFPCP
jgi:hypothetical protein